MTDVRRKPLNLFYEEPDGDRWLPLDRFPRRILRRIRFGKPMVSGQRRVFVNLCAGLDRLGVPYRVNNYRYLRRHPDEVACVLGKGFVAEKLQSPNPILFGPALKVSHPMDDPHLLERLPVRLVIVPGEWVRVKYEPYYGDRVVVWPTGIDTDLWAPSPAEGKDVDVLFYDKVRWRHDEFEQSLINPLMQALQKKNLRVETIRYGRYREDDFRRLLARSKSMVFLCEHESQGIAYQQALSCGVPLLAWDRGGYWEDPEYYPHKAKFEPVTSVPYWDDRCGLKFENAAAFPTQLDRFWTMVQGGEFSPRQYILENLTLEKCAQEYLDLVTRIEAESAARGELQPR